jgi:hypothetical protein
MTPKATGNGSLRLALAILATAATVASASWALMAGKIDDRVAPVAATVARNTERIDECERAQADTRERLARIETKLDALLARGQR